MISNKNTEIAAQATKTINSEITVYARKTKEGDTIYKIEEILKGNILNSRHSTTLFGSIGSYKITPQQALDLYNGHDVSITFQTKSGSNVEAYLGAKEIQIKTNKAENGTIYENPQLIVGIAFPQKKKGTDEIYAYNIDQTKFFTNLSVFGEKEETIQLKPADCLRLCAKNRIFKDGYEIVRHDDNVKEFEDGTKQRIAKLTAYPQTHLAKKLQNEECLSMTV